MAILSSGFIGIRKLGIVDTVALVAVSLLHQLISLLLREVHNVLNDLGFLDSLQKLVAKHRLAAELTGLGGQLLLGLRCEGRVDNGTVDEQEQMVLDLRRL